MEKLLICERAIDKTYQKQRAKKIKIRLADICAVAVLVDMTHYDRFHRLTGGRYDGYFSVDLDGPFRLLFDADNDPLPTLSNGGLDISQVDEVVIVAVEDTHDNKHKK